MRFMRIGAVLCTGLVIGSAGAGTVVAAPAELVETAGTSTFSVSNPTDSIDANISGSEVEEVFDAEVEAIRYLRDEQGKSIEEINRVLKQSRDIPFLDQYVGNHLNDQEKALYRENRALALLCLANGKLALDYASEMYKSGLHNGNGDAFRHALWNYGMAIDVGQSFAKRWSDAHEYGTANNPVLERKMDLHNNSVGLQLAKDNPGTILHSTFKNKTREKVRNGTCRRIASNKLIRTDSSGEK